MQIRLLFVFFAAALGLMAQSETGRAALKGTVSDPSGQSVAFADITIHGTQTGLQRALRTNAVGTFRVSSLPVGIYTLEAVSAGFGTSMVDNIALTVGETKNVTIRLQVTSVS